MGNAEYMGSPSKNPIMVFGVLTSLAVFATAVSGLDLGCGDFSYDVCHDPPAAQELHVGTPEEEMAIYMAACGVRGQPMTTNGMINGTCVQGPADDCAPTCTAPCLDCSTDKCRGYKGSECVHTGPPGETVELPDAAFTACLSICTLQMTDNDFTYLTFDNEQAECICYSAATFTCTHQVVIQGMTIDEANACH